MVYGVGGLSGICRICGTFCGLGIQGQPDGYLVRNMFEGSFTEEVTGAGKAIFEWGFKFSASEARKNFYSTASVVHIEEDWYAYPSTQEYQQLEVTLNHRVKWSMIQPGSYRWVIEEKLHRANIREQIWKRVEISEWLLAIYEKQEVRDGR